MVKTESTQVTTSVDPNVYTINTESHVFHGGVLIASAAGLTLTIINATYYSKVAKSTGGCNLSQSTANTMMWLNIILAVIFGIVFIYALFRAFVHPDTRKQISKKTTEVLTQPRTSYPVNPSNTNLYVSKVGETFNTAAPSQAAVTA